MGVRVSSLCPPRTFTFVYEDQAIEVTYTRQHDTPAFINETGQMSGVDGTVALLEKVLVSWDLLDDNDRPWGTDAESLAELPFHFLRACSNAIVEDVVGGKGSSNGSVPSTTSTAAAPTGTPTTPDATE